MLKLQSLLFDLRQLLKITPRHLLASPVRWRSDALEHSTYRQGERKIADHRGRPMEIAWPITISHLMTIERVISVHVSAGEPSDSDHDHDPITIEIVTKI